MTVKELKELLENYDDGDRIFIEGYEGGYADLKSIREVTMALNVNTEAWYYGDHEEVGRKEYKDKEHVKGIALE